MPIDTVALLNTTRALLVIFIILICIINFILLGKQVRKVRFYQNPKLMTIISLAIGDIMMAMFPLVVLAKYNFELDLSALECRHNSAYGTYYGFLLHFVYGLSLIALGIEVLTRSKLRSLCSPSVTAVVMGGIPWFLGLIIILPLCMAKIDYTRCINYETPTAMFTVSVFMPASLAVLLLIIFNCIRLPVDQQPHQQMNAVNFQPTLVNSQQVAIMPSSNTQSNLNVASSNYPQTAYPDAQNPAPVGSHYLYQNLSQYPPNHQGMAQYPPNDHGMVQYPPNQQSMAQFPPVHQGMAQYPPNQQGMMAQYPPNQQGMVAQYPPNHHGMAQYPPNQQSMALFPPVHQGMAQYPPNQQGMVAQYPPMQQGQVMYNSNHVTIVHQTQPGNTVYVPDMRRTELQRLLIISILFFFMVVPYAAITLTTGGVLYLYYDNSYYSLTVAIVALNWLMVARSCLTPLVMISYSDL